jgi:rhomboid protease GluP
MVVTSKTFFFENDTLLKWGGDAGILVQHGQWWRLFTSMFLHANPIHIGFNMLCLLQLGLLAELAFGKIPYLLAYIATGICSSLVSIFVHPTTLSVGASGAIFGVAGFLLTPIALKKLTIYTTSKSSILRSLVMFAIYNLAIGAAIPVIDNSAHIGGLVSGLIVGLFFCTRPRTVGSPPRSSQSAPPPANDSIESRSTREIGR